MTGDSVNYKYINSNSPEEKINYSYSKYGGEAFLSAYRESREGIISQVNIDNKILLTHIGFGETEKLFIDWISKLKDNSGIELERLNLLLKRFEVTKKIYENYDIDFRPTNKSEFKNYRLYILYAYVLSASYSKYNKVQYLNSLLKVNDINISIWTYLDTETKKLLAICLQTELDFINNLNKKLK
jgi:hypothetical protein